MSAGTSLVAIDGAYGEGGGALLRVALAMSAMTQQPLRLSNVRGATNYPGLDPEDITIIRAMAESCGAETSGIAIGSPSFSFLPSRRAKGISGRLDSVRNESNRGANALVVLNSLLPLMARSGVYCSVVAEGETFGSNALSFDAFSNVTLQALRKMGLYAYATLQESGFGRESVGEVLLDVEPSHIQGIDWSDRGALQSFQAVVSTCNLPQNVAERAIDHLSVLAKQANLPLTSEHLEIPGSSQGCFITVSAAFERGFGGGAAMGARGLRVESLAQAAFEEAREWIKSEAATDPYLADQILLPCVFAEGSSSFSISRLTQRFLTSVWVVKQFTPIHVTVRGSENRPGTITIQK